MARITAIALRTIPATTRRGGTRVITGHKLLRAYYLLPTADYLSLTPLQLLPATRCKRKLSLSPIPLQLLPAAVCDGKFLLRGSIRQVASSLANCAEIGPGSAYRAIIAAQRAHLSPPDLSRGGRKDDYLLVAVNGGRARTRTGMPRRAADFKSAVSTVPPRGLLNVFNGLGA